MSNPNPEKIRLQIDVSPSQIETIDGLMKDCGLSTRKDLFNNAMTLLEWAVGEVRQGNIIAALNLDDGQYVELRMPALSHAARWRNGDTRQRRKLAIASANPE